MEKDRQRRREVNCNKNRIMRMLSIFGVFWRQPQVLISVIMYNFKRFFLHRYSIFCYVTAAAFWKIHFSYVFHSISNAILTLCAAILYPTGKYIYFSLLNRSITNMSSRTNARIQIRRKRKLLNYSHCVPVSLVHYMCVSAILLGTASNRFLSFGCVPSNDTCVSKFNCEQNENMEWNAHNRTHKHACGTKQTRKEKNK